MIELAADSSAGILVLGLLVGMQHAMEADHVAAVSSIAARQSSLRRIVTHGAVWGLGHTLTLMLVAGSAIVLGVALNEVLASWLELIVGVMLIGLGGHVLFILIRERIHFHRHKHKDGTVHFHAHSHQGEEAPHNAARHDHSHPKSLPLKTLLVGMMHGMAGSAALVVLAAATVKSAPIGIAYVVLFGLGSVAGMAALSALIAVPLVWSARALTWANNGLQGAIGTVTVVLGAMVVVESWSGIAAV